MLHLSNATPAGTTPATPEQWECRAIVLCAALVERSTCTPEQLRYAAPILESGLSAARQLGHRENAELIEAFLNDVRRGLASVERDQPRCPQCDAALRFEPLRQIAYCLCGFEQTAEELHGGPALARRQLDPIRPALAFRRLAPGDLAR